MSYILDALKKSERDRVQADVPDWNVDHTIGQASPTKQQLYTIYGLSGVLVILVLGIFITWLNLPTSANHQNADEANQTKTPTNTLPEVVVETAENKTTEKRNKVSFKQFREAQLTAVKHDKNIQKNNKKPQRVVFSTEPLDASVDSSEEISNSNLELDVDDQTPAAPRKIVDISELPDELQTALPEIQFSGHVYTGNRKRSSVMINGTKLRQGQSIEQGLKIYKITAAGVILKFRGWRFRLSALQDWGYSGH